MGNDLVERLNKGCILAQDGLGGVDMNATDALCQEAAARILALEEARASLKPFAEEAQAWVKMGDNYRPAAYSGAFSVGDLRRAYANKGEQ